MAITFDIRDNATPALKEKMRRAQNLGPFLGRTVVNLLRAHFYDLEKTRANKLGGKRTHFYGQAARSTTYVATPKNAIVAVAQLGIRQRFQGGTIVPRTAKWLTIPVAKEAYGKRAREFKDLYLLRSKGLPFGLYRNSDNLMMYRLLKRVVQKPDPSVIPEKRIGETIMSTAKDYLGGENPS